VVDDFAKIALEFEIAVSNNTFARATCNIMLAAYIEQVSDVSAGCTATQESYLIYCSQGDLHRIEELLALMIRHNLPVTADTYR
jgi:hypothetical protein